MKEWIECQDCGEEFRVISAAETDPSYCPYCGSAIEFDLDYEDDELEFDE